MTLARVKNYFLVIYFVSTKATSLDNIGTSKAVTIFYNFIQTRYSMSYISILVMYFDTINSFIITIELFKKSIFSKCEIWMYSTENTTIYQMESDDVK
jgi:hypothetical protein